MRFIDRQHMFIFVEYRQVIGELGLLGQFPVVPDGEPGNVR